jgi:Luciferase
VRRSYDRPMPRDDVLIDEIANELETWPGVRIERRPDGGGVVRYEELELGVLHPEPAAAELSFSHAQHDALVEHGDAEPADPAPESRRVRHQVEGPSDVTAILELFDRRYRDLRGEDDPYSSEDPA